MTWKKARMLYDILAVIGFILLLAGVWEKMTLLAVAGVVCMALCTFVSLKWCRCPHCGAHLGRSRSLNHCPACGGEL